MATLTGIVQFTGTIGDLSMYRMSGTDKIIVRRKGGASGNRVRNHPDFENTRRLNEEWKGCVLAGKSVVAAIRYLDHFRDFNYRGLLHKQCKSIQKMDHKNEWGNRQILFSENHSLLEGFSLTRFKSFESVVRHPLEFGIDKNNGTAFVQLPDLLPDINLYNPQAQPMYRFVCSVAVMPDIVYHNARHQYEPVATTHAATVVQATAWSYWKERLEGTRMELQLLNWKAFPGLSLVLAAGVEFGTPVANNEVKTARYAGVAKILKVS